MKERIWEMVKEAKELLKGVVYHTPLDRSRNISKITGLDVYLKLENLQRTGSFKIRGAYYKISKIKEGCKFVVAASTGNHAQGVACAASMAGVASKIVMPVYTPLAKVEATRNYGAQVVLHGTVFEEALKKAREICKEEGGVFIHPFDDPQIIAGQGTIALEILEDLPDADAIIVPVGGGGLISGIAVAAKKLRPNIKIFGVEASGACSAYKSLKEGRIVRIAKVDTIADAIAIKEPSRLTFELMQELVDEIFLVDDEAIMKAMLLLLERSKQVVEPAAATTVAALLEGLVPIKRGKVVALLSGGNVDMLMLARIINKALALEKRIVRLRAVLEDSPKVLASVMNVLSRVRMRIISVEHDRISPHINPGKAEVTITLEISSFEALEELLRELRNGGFEFEVIWG